ncbi:craniofacial development protein 1-like [Drosophila elegans]|uniref:craniofacial development protein 1-like n=1 Tax=Drosophila elegans TaxID=30023 RepID=UPI001BC832B1|nr:craniofacial development protein 1-like [Drosophila elegans]
MNIEFDHDSDCESDKDFCLDGENLGLGTSEESVSEDSDKESKTNVYLNIKKNSVDVKKKDLCRTRQSDCIKNYRLTTDKDTLPSDEETEKSRSETLWADFLSDVGSESQNNQETVHKPNIAVDKNAGICLKNLMDVQKTKNFTIAKKNSSLPGSKSRLEALKRPLHQSGAGSLIDKLEKKRKFSVLEKSQMDWKNFKRDEGIDEQLRTHNKGKDGYLERQEFLQRTDFRQFEIEKKLRQSRRPN